MISLKREQQEIAANDDFNAEHDRQKEEERLLAAADKTTFQRYKNDVENTGTIL